MSIALPLVDLSSAILGTSGSIAFSNVGISAGGVSSNPTNLFNRAHVRLHNNSKFGLYIAFQQEGHSDHLDPGAWRTYDLIPGESGVNWQVEAIMNATAPIAILSATYYAPGENVDDPGTLGNSPIGGTAITTGQTLSNEGNPSNLLVIDMGDVTFNQLVTIYNDGHSVWAVDQAGVKHQVFKIQTTGNPLQLGQAGDTTDVLGTLTAVAVKCNSFRDNTNGNLALDLSAGTGAVTLPQLATLSLGASLPNNIALQSLSAAAAAFNLLSVDASNKTHLRSGAVGAEVNFQDSAGTMLGWFNSGGGGVQAGKFQAAGTNGGITLVVGGISRISVISFTTANGTTAAIAHNLGTTPDAIFGNAFTSGVSSANVTIGFSEVGATTFKATSIAVVPALAICIKL